MKTVVYTLAIAFGVVSSTSAFAEHIPCRPYEEFAGKLLQQFGEVPIGSGIAESGAPMTFFASPDGTWTALLTKPDGESCLAAAGRDWKEGAGPELSKTPQGPFRKFPG